jgi:hypothetical protein
LPLEATVFVSSTVKWLIGVRLHLVKLIPSNLAHPATLPSVTNHSERAQIPGAHKNTWIKTKVDLSSVPHLGVARDSSRCFVCGDRPPYFGSVKAIRPKRIRTGLGQ